MITVDFSFALDYTMSELIIYLVLSVRILAKHMMCRVGPVSELCQRSKSLERKTYAPSHESCSCNTRPTHLTTRLASRKSCHPQNTMALGRLQPIFLHFLSLVCTQRCDCCGMSSFRIALFHLTFCNAGH